ncbi:Hypothetical predicted protein [Lecanosticta acicola]|uniref:Large ribosomal subunit protein mL38 n=1 Tax=Lecanosticta acicola TaxID=111012 RepID=A0AAI8YXD9_9PEZI|nr:Hypothetical predicted protein [Lecanosticta acicola]
MALERSTRPLAKCLRCTRHDRISLPIRAFSNTPAAREEQTVSEAQPAPAASSAPKKKLLDPETVSSPRKERKLVREQHRLPIGSRRRRAALATSQNIPFTELPYQCFQEARQYLLQDRQRKLEEIAIQRTRIAKLQDKVVVDEREQQKKEHSLKTMRQRLEHTKILADINDPLVKKRFEDGLADMNKPIYRHLADQKWRSYERRLVMQRVTTMNVVPDVIPAIDPTLSTSLNFEFPNSRGVRHGDIVESRVSERPAILRIQKYEKGEKLYTIAVINPDVPDVAKDGFSSRMHFLACNIPLSPTNTLVRLSQLNKDTQVALPWLPAYAQKGLPYQRMAIVILEQPAPTRPPAGSNDVIPSTPVDVSKLRNLKNAREKLTIRSLMSVDKLMPVGVDLFRTQWDEGTAGVMQRAGVIGWDVEFKRKRIEPLPYQRLKGERYR